MFEPFVKGWEVFSAHAEVVPYKRGEMTGFGGILRACGGSSAMTHSIFQNETYSPRMRR